MDLMTMQMVALIGILLLFSETLCLTQNCDPISAVQFKRLDENLVSQQVNQRIPKILHHIFLGTRDFAPLSGEKEAEWNKSVSSCLEHSHDFFHIQWNSSMVMALLMTYYPWAVQMYERYPYPVQRADSARYFILHRYGGMYLDMDDGCKWNISDIYALMDPAGATIALPHAKPFGHSNWVMISIPRDPFFEYLINHLNESSKTYGLPYLTVLKSAGPLFLSRSLDEFRSNDVISDRTIVYELTVEQTDTEMFYRTYGSTWHSIDGIIIWNFYQHRYILVFICTLVGIVLVVLYRKYKRRKVTTAVLGNVLFSSRHSICQPLLSKEIV